MHQRVSDSRTVGGEVYGPHLLGSVVGQPDWLAIGKQFHVNIAGAL